jgi:hypothetical protein
VKRNRDRGVAIRAAILEACRTSIDSGIPLPPLHQLAALCGLSGRAALSRHVSVLCGANDLARIAPGPPPVFRLRDGRCTPGGTLPVLRSEKRR